MIADHKRNKFTFIHSIFFGCLGLFVISVLITNYITVKEAKLTDKIYPNVYIDHRNVGGKTKAELSHLYQQQNTTLDNVKIKIIYKDQEVATLSGKIYTIHSDGVEVVERAYLIGRTPHLSTRIREKITTLFNLGRYDFTTRITYNQDPFDDTVNILEQQFNIPAKNALFTFENGKVSSFRPDEKGLKIQSEKLVKNFVNTLQELETHPQDKKIYLSDMVVEPETTLSEANNFGVEELISEGTSDYTHSIPERVYNVTFGASKFHGVLIPKDKIFSFNEVIGDVSSSTGFKPAYIIKNGRTVLGDGGGVCQISTTLFRAALDAGLPIIERFAHAYRVAYYENDAKPGFDATVYDPYADLKFKNDTPAAILIQTEIDKENNLLTFRFYGKKDSRKAEISDVKLYDQQPPPPPLYQDDPTQPRGVVKQVDFAAWGAKASLHYKVTKDNNIVFEKTFFSVYRPWQAVFLQGTAG